MNLWLIAAGLTLVFGVARILNAAHGSLYMVGGYMAFTFYHMMGLNFGFALVLTMLTVGAVGYFMERFFLRPIYNQELAFQLVLTFAFIMVFENLVGIIWGTASHVVAVPSLMSGPIYIFGRSFPRHGLWVIGIGAAIYVLMLLIINRTWQGKTLRVASSDREMASCIGINVPVVLSVTFAIAAALAALGGTVNLPMQALHPGIGGEVIIMSFVVTIIGTLGHITGAFLMSIVIGVLTAITALYASRYAVFVPYALMAIILIVRPGGIFGAGESK